MNITLEPVKLEEKQILKNLGELYIYELTQYTPTDVDDMGLYDDFDDLDLYWTDENRHPYFIKVDGKLGGFALVFDGRQIQGIDSNYSIDEFFVMNQYKGRGVGKYCAGWIFDKFRGKWQIWFHPRNKAAEKFWTGVVDEYTDGRFEVVGNDEPFYDGVVGSTLVFGS